MSLATGDVWIQVTGDSSPDMQVFANSANQIGEIKPTGVTIKYGINMVPYAMLDLTPRDLALVCDIEKWRRTPVKIRIESKLGCMTFRGLIDGLSLSQSVGDMRMQLIIKSPFQVMHELNPKLLGYHSAGVDFTRRVESLTQERNENNLVSLKYAVGSSISVDLNKPLFEGIIAILNAIVDSQVGWQLTQARTGKSAEAAVLAAEALRTTHLKMAKVLLARVDTSFVPTQLTLADYFTTNWVLEAICETRTNMYDLLLSLLEIVGCSLVIGNDRAFVVPSSGFLQQSHQQTINFRDFSKAPNVLYPSQYNNVSFSDNGYRDVSGVYIQSDDRNITQIDGFFQDKQAGGKGGIIGESMPYVISFNNASLRAAKYKELTDSLGDATQPHTAVDTSVGTPTSEEEQHAALLKTVDSEAVVAEAKQRAQDASLQEAYDTMTRFANEWAKLRYYQLKYTDRMGGISTMFNPNFAPGAVGSVYLRSPGVYIDYFVTEITHDIRVSAPDSGSALTTVNFNGGRMGAIKSAPLSAGLEKFDLFNGYSAATSAKVAAAFIKDTQ